MISTQSLMRRFSPLKSSWWKVIGITFQKIQYRNTFHWEIAVYTKPSFGQQTSSYIKKSTLVPDLRLLNLSDRAEGSSGPLLLNWHVQSALVCLHECEAWEAKPLHLYHFSEFEVLPASIRLRLKSEPGLLHVDWVPFQHFTALTL